MWLVAGLTDSAAFIAWLAKWYFVASYMESERVCCGWELRFVKQSIESCVQKNASAVKKNVRRGLCIHIVHKNAICISCMECCSSRWRWEWRLRTAFNRLTANISSQMAFNRKILLHIQSVKRSLAYVICIELWLKCGNVTDNEEPSSAQKKQKNKKKLLPFITENLISAEADECEIKSNQKKNSILTLASKKQLF